MAYNNPNIVVEEPIRDPEPIYRPSAAKAAGATFKGFTIEVPAIERKHEPRAIQAHVLCSIQDQILWLTQCVTALQSEKFERMMNEQKVNKSLVELHEKLRFLTELEHKDVKSAFELISQLQVQVGDLLAEKASHAKITTVGVEAAMSRASRKKNRRKR